MLARTLLSPQDIRTKATELTVSPKSHTSCLNLTCTLKGALD